MHNVAKKVARDEKVNTPITIRSGDIDLEGVLYRDSASRAVVVTHPHPLYGGDMDNPVVTAIAAVYQEMGWSTLRFNFRGVGASEGKFDEGRGEQDDLQAAVEYLKSLNFSQIDLAGYSFGSWVIGRWARRGTSPDTATGCRIILVSPPVAFMDFSEIGPIAGLEGVITGDMDDIAPPEKIEAMLPRWRSEKRLVVLSHTDHFYSGRLDALQDGLRNILAQFEAVASKCDQA